jgi:hypothetical protein
MRLTIALRLSVDGFQSNVSESSACPPVVRTATKSPTASDGAKVRQNIATAQLDRVGPGSGQKAIVKLWHLYGMRLEVEGSVSRHPQTRFGILHEPDGSNFPEPPLTAAQVCRPGQSQPATVSLASLTRR